MSLWSLIFGGGEAEPVESTEHAVVVRFPHPGTDLQPISDLEDKLRAAIDNANAGEFDGNEIAVDGSEGLFYMYGNDADELFEAVRSTLEESPLMKGAVAKLRYGPSKDGVKEIERTISS